MTKHTGIKGNQIVLASRLSVAFTFTIGDAIDFGNVVVVRLEIPRGTIFNENVYGIGPDGRIIWQIQPEYPPTWDGAWGGLEDRGGQAVLSNSESKILFVDPATGNVTQRGMSAR